MGLIEGATYRKRAEVARLHGVLVPHMDRILQPGVLLEERQHMQIKVRIKSAAKYELRVGS